MSQWPAAKARRVLGLIGTSLVSACGSAVARDDGPPCISWSPPALRPLLVGDTTQLRVGRARDSDCDGTRLVPVDAATWHTPDSAIVRVAPHGVVKGLVPGVFQLEATVEGRELHARGFVLPPGWRVRLSPDSFDVRVGDTLRLQVRAETADGVMLPAVPSRLVTPEYLDWAREVIPDMHAGRHTRSPDERGGLFDRTFFQSTEVAREGVFVARRAGVTMLVGSIGSRAETARVVVRPAAAPRQ